MKEIGDIVRHFEQHREEPLALATLVQCRGSSYRRPGARMLIAGDGSTAGSLSGGCLEDEVVECARAVIRNGTPRRLSFDTRRRFGCNGALEILIEKPAAEFLDSLAAHHRERRPCWISTGFATAGSRVLPSNEMDGAELHQWIEPSPRLLVFGQGPDSAALCAIARALGWQVTQMESASELTATADRWTAAIVKTHNYGRDFAVLRQLIPLALPYIGLLGPRVRREQLLGDLLDTGITAGPHLHAPAGLDLGGSSPETVALSIIAEIQMVLGEGTGKSLRDRKTPIHFVAEAPAIAAA